MERYNRIIQNEIFSSLMDRLDKLEADRKFCNHDLTHLLDVSRIAYIMALENKLDLSKDVIYAAGLLHDIGRVAEYENEGEHQTAGAAVAAAIMDLCGYSKEEISAVQDAITGHREEKEGSLLNNLLYAADKLSRNCFCCKAHDECKWPENRRNKGAV